VAANLHIEAMAWLRYTKQMPLVCTEVGRWNADVLALGPKYSIEVEVKKTLSDLRADFRGKRAKHYTYLNAAEDKWTREVPNYLYYIVPEALAEKALPIVEKSNPKYGLLVVPTNSLGHETSSLGYGAGKNIIVAKKATRLHDKVPQDSTFWTAIRRLSSELVGLYQGHEELQQKVCATLEDIRANIRAGAALMAGFTRDPPDTIYEDQNDTVEPHPNPPEREADPLQARVQE
jgi:hypothetical protein